MSPAGVQNIGIDLGGTSIRAAILNGSSINSIQSIKVDKEQGAEGILKQIVELIDRLRTSSLNGIGIGVPSYVDVERGIVFDTVNLPGWEKIPLKEILEKETGVSVYINNDANCFILGEKHYGKAKPYSSVVGLTLGTGLGTGIIINDRLYNGKNCGAGEISSLPYLDKTYEYYTSSEFFEQEHFTTALNAYENAEKGDRQSLEIFQKYGIHIGEFLKVVLTAYDPEAIVLGGSISKAYRHFSENMYETLSRFHFKQYLKNLKIELSESDHSALFGAAQLCLEK